MARIHDVFIERITALQETAGNLADGFDNGNNTPWAAPVIAQALADPTALTPTFARGEINAEYNEAISGGKGKLGDSASLLRQIGYVSVEERAMRLRYASTPRLLTMCYGRLKGHANSDGVFGKVQRAAENLAAAGGSTPLPIGQP